MNSFFPNDTKKIKTRIKSYERSLSNNPDDGYGKRYLLGPMYLLADDLKGALKHFAWFDEEYDDDGGEPYQYLCWTLALYKSGLIDEAVKKFKQTMLQNLYLIPILLGQSPNELDIWHGSNLCQLDYAKDIPPELLGLWDNDAKDWASATWNDNHVVEFREAYIDIERRLKNLAPGPKRSALVNESFRMRDGFMPLKSIK